MITHKETVLLVTTFMGCYKSVDCPLHAGDKQLWMTRGPKENQSFFLMSYKYEEWQNGKSYEVQSQEALRKSAENGMDANAPTVVPIREQEGSGDQGTTNLWLWWSRTFLPWLGSSERLRWCLRWRFFFFLGLWLEFQAALEGRHPTGPHHLCLGTGTGVMGWWRAASAQEETCVFADAVCSLC